MMAPHPRSPSPARVESLAVIVEQEHVLCALPAAQVLRLALPEEVAPLGRTASGAAVVKLGAEPYVALDLHALLGLPEPSRTAWVIAALEHQGAPVAIALRTGPCLAVRRLPRAMRLPKVAFRDHGDAFPAAFPGAALPDIQTAASYGLWLDLERLVGPEILREAARLGGDGAITEGSRRGER